MPIRLNATSGGGEALAYRERRHAIRARLQEFQEVWRRGSDELLFEELVFCIFTAGASARMGLNSVGAVRSLLAAGTHEELAFALAGVHRYPRARSGYIVVTREYLQEDCGMRLRERLAGFDDPIERRDWLRASGVLRDSATKRRATFCETSGFAATRSLISTFCEVSRSWASFPLPTRRQRALAISPSKSNYDNSRASHRLTSTNSTSSSGQ